MEVYNSDNKYTFTALRFLTNFKELCGPNKALESTLLRIIAPFIEDEPAPDLMV